MHVNHDGAQQCYDRAKEALAAGDHAKAARLLERSLRMFHTPQAESLLARLRSHAQARDDGAARPPPQATASARAEPGPTRPRRSPPPPSPAPSQPSASPTPSTPKFTQQQEDDAQRILKSKDLYEVLGVTRNASDPEIKKAYRKLALVFHPDKNQAPHAEDAFKRVSHAFQTLSDKEKRAHYDQFGEEEEVQRHVRQRRHGGGHGGGMTYEEVSPEELFHMFFGGGFGGAGLHARHQHFRRQQARRQPSRSHAAEEEGGSGVYQLQLLQLLPLLLLFLMSFMSFSSRDEHAFSLEATPDFKFPRVTSMRQVHYFLHTDSARKARMDPNWLSDLEQQVESAHAQQLKHRCIDERRYQQNLMYRGKITGNRDLMQQAESLPMTSCNEFQKFMGQQ